MQTFALVVTSIALGLFGAVRCIEGDLYVGFAALAAAAIGIRVAPGLWPLQPDTSGRLGTAAGFLLVAAALVFFRFYRIVPPGLWGDDALNGLLAFDVLDGRIDSPFALVSHAHSRFHALTNYAIAASFSLLGADLVSLRVPGTIAGCVAGVALYGIARRTFGETTAVFAGLLFASSPMQIIHSKNLTQVVLGLMFQCVGIYALLRGIDQRSKAWLATSSAALAATVYTYHAAKLAPFAAIPLLLAALWRSRIGLRSLLPAVATLVVCLLPAMVSFAREPQALLGRAQAVSIVDEIRASGSIDPLLMSTAKTLGIFHVAQGPKYDWFGPGDDPALTPLTAALVGPGLIAALAGWRRSRHLLLLWWFAVGLAPAILSTDAPRVYRALHASPPLFIWAAMPLAAMWQSRVARVPLRFVAVALVAAGLLFDFNYYFHRSYTHPRMRWMVGERILETARIARDAGAGRIGYLMSPTFGARHESVRLLSRMWNLDIRDATSLHFALNDAAVAEGGAVFLTTPRSHGALDYIGAWLDTPTPTARYDPKPHTWWNGSHWPYQAPALRPQPVAAGLIVERDEIEAHRSSRARLPLTVTCRTHYAVTERRDPVPFYNFFSNTFEKPSRCRWDGWLRVPGPAAAAIRMVSDPPMELRFDGEKVARQSQLAPGTHRVSISMMQSRRRVRLQLFWKLADKPEALIPQTAWRARQRSSTAPADITAPSLRSE